MITISFISVSGARVIQAGWKDICIIPSGSVTISNSLSPEETITITTPFSIGVNTPNIEPWGEITITGTADVVLNGAGLVNQ